MSENAKEAIFAAARRAAQARGYGGLNFRDLAAEVGIKAASVHHHFPGKAALGVAVARRYHEDLAAELAARSDGLSSPLEDLRWHPQLFRRALTRGNRMCLASFLAADSDDVPEAVMAEVRRFGAINVAWLAETLTAAGIAAPGAAEDRASAIFAAVAGAQLMARGRGDVALFDRLIDSYRRAGLLP